ncbi:MAG: proteasome assembly chaperone family protein [Thermoproteales archaeon]|nr:proteasome assembly chaperone family protein [Thermoproteales archaeon]RLE64279.1 MAG: proteasome assembly chaperone family protein [Thermoprotei archaeon]
MGVNKPVVEITVLPEVKHGFRIRGEKPVVVVGLPDTGLVGTIAVTYLTEKSGMEEIGFIDSPQLPPVLPFHKNIPRFPIRIMNKGRFVAIFSEIAIPVDLMTPLAKTLISFMKEIDADTSVLLGGIAVPNRIDLEKPSVYGLGITEDDRKFLEAKGVKLLDEGFLAGAYAQIVKECIKETQRGIILLGESYANYPDPGAAAAVLETFSKIFDFKIDVKPLIDQAEELRLKLRELMKRTIETLRSAQKRYERALPPLYR